MSFEKEENIFLLDWFLFYGQLALLILLCKDSEKQPNGYGPSPKYVLMEDTPTGLINDTDYLNPNSLL